MSDKSWREIDASTIAKSWSKLLSVPDILECEQTNISVEIDAVMNELQVPNEERSEWLMQEQSDPENHEFTDEELVEHVTEISTTSNEVDEVLEGFIFL